MTSIKVKKYRKANILILNEFQSFISVVFYRGNFYQIKTDAIKHGEYTNGEYTEAIENAYTEAKKLADAIITSRSIKFRIKQLWQEAISRRIAERAMIRK